MMNKEELPADIIAEMRRWIRQEGNRATWDWRPGNGWSEAAMRAHLENAAEEWKLLLDRLEAAQKREPGNAAAMRAALEIAHDYFDAGDASRMDAAIAVKAALSLPPRNCDLPLVVDGPADNNADDAWCAFKQHNSDAYFDVPGLLRCIDWLLAPAAETEGDVEDRRIQ